MKNLAAALPGEQRRGQRQRGRRLQERAPRKAKPVEHR